MNYWSCKIQNKDGCITTRQSEVFKRKKKDKVSIYKSGSNHFRSYLSGTVNGIVTGSFTVIFEYSTLIEAG